MSVWEYDTLCWWEVKSYISFCLKVSFVLGLR